MESLVPIVNSMRCGSLQNVQKKRVRGMGHTDFKIYHSINPNILSTNEWSSGSDMSILNIYLHVRHCEFIRKYIIKHNGNQYIYFKIQNSFLSIILNTIKTDVEDIRAWLLYNTLFSLLSWSGEKNLLDLIPFLSFSV